MILRFATVRGSAVLLVLSLAACAPRTGEVTSSPSSTAPVEVTGDRTNVVRVGQELDVRLQSPLSSGTATVETRFQATTLADMTQDGRVLIPAGSVVRGVVSGVPRATRIDRTGSLTLAFNQLAVRGLEYPITANAVRVFESDGLRGEADRIGVGASAGGIIGEVQGAVAGVLIGGGGVIAATEGKEVTLPAGTIVRIRMDPPLIFR